VIGGSTDTGLENNKPVPQVFRTNVATTGNLAIGPEFLALNNNVNESGLRAFWSLHKYRPPGLHGRFCRSRLVDQSALYRRSRGQLVLDPEHQGLHRVEEDGAHECCAGKRHSAVTALRELELRLKGFLVLERIREATSYGGVT
jgi:hypothetical protein